MHKYPPPPLGAPQDQPTNSETKKLILGIRTRQLMFLAFHISNLLYFYVLAVSYTFSSAARMCLDPDGTFPATFIEIPIPVFFL